MTRFNDSITIGVQSPVVATLLSDLEQHPYFVPDGFKQYRYLSRELKGVGARAAVDVNLLGHWLPSELEVTAVGENEIRMVLRCEPARLDLAFSLLNRGERTEVRLEVVTVKRPLSLWRVRTRIKQQLRLESDVANLCGRFLSQVKTAAEATRVAPKPVEPPPAPKAASKEAASKAAEPKAAAKAASRATEARSAEAKAAPSVPSAESRPAMEAKAQPPTPTEPPSTGASAAASTAKPKRSARSVEAAADETVSRETVAHETVAAATVAHETVAASTPERQGETEAPMAAQSSMPTGSAVLSTVDLGAELSGNAPAAASDAETGWIFAAKTSDLGPGQARMVQVAGQEVAVFHVEEGFFALSNQCPHRRGPLAFGLISGKEVTCPLHSWTFDVTDGHCTNIPSARVPCFGVEVRGDEVYVRASASTPASA